MAFTKKPRVFILGISGLLGNALAWRLRKDFDVTGAYFQHPIQIPDVQTYPINNPATATNLLESLVSILRPNFCIMATGVNDRKLCSENPKITENVNIYLPLSLAVMANKIKAKNIHLSCSDIFDGIVGNYKEKDVTSFSLEDYSKQKISAETFIKAQTMENTTLRLGRVVGLGSPFRYNYFDHIRKNLAAGKNITASPNKLRNFLSLSATCDAIETVLKNPIPSQHRIFHLGGPMMSELELMRLLCVNLGYDLKFIRTPNPKEDKKSNLTIDTSLFRSTYPTWKIETPEELVRSILMGLRPGLKPRQLQMNAQIP